MGPEKAARLAANGLMLAYKRVVPDDGTGVLGNFRAAESGRFFVLTPESMNAFAGVARKLVPFLDFFPLEKCIERLITFVIEEKDKNTPIPEVHERLNRTVAQFLNGFSSQGEWKLLSPVRGIDLTEGPFTYGVCTFSLFNDDDFRLWGRRFSSGQHNPDDDVTVTATWVKHVGPLKGQVVVEVEVRAADREHAKVKGLKRIEETLNVLRYAKLTWNAKESEFPEVGLLTAHDFDHHCVVVRVDERDSSASFAGRPADFSLSICRHARGWEGLSQLVRLELSARSEIQLRLTTALEWIGQAALTPSNSIRLVALTTALEALLIEEGESLGKKSKLSNRVSRIIATSDSEVPRLIEQVEELYTTRSECVHSGFSDVENAELEKAVQFVARVIGSITTTSPYCNAASLEELLTIIDPSLSQLGGNYPQWVEENAYFRWLNDGCPCNRQHQHWLDAQREFVCERILRGRSLDSLCGGRQTGGTE